MTPPEIRDHYRRTGRRHLSRFFFNDTATPEIYTLSLHDALPISGHHPHRAPRVQPQPPHQPHGLPGDRKSTRLNSSHANISYAVFCLEKKDLPGCSSNFCKSPRVYIFSPSPAESALMLSFIFFNDTATTEIYTLSLHDALPISGCSQASPNRSRSAALGRGARHRGVDRKSTRLNSSHTVISHAVFCLKEQTRHLLSNQVGTAAHGVRRLITHQPSR